MDQRSQRWVGWATSRTGVVATLLAAAVVGALALTGASDNGPDPGAARSRAPLPPTTTTPGPASTPVVRASPAVSATPASSAVGAVDPARFAAGACMAYPPTHGDRHLTVFLDAGHGGPDPGGVGVTTSGRQVTEAEETLRVELDTMAILRAEGFRVVVSRTANTSVVRLTPADLDGNELSVQGVRDDVAARDLCANLAGADLLIGIYFNAGAAAGCLTAYDTARPFRADNERLADLVQRDVLHAMNAKGWDIPDDGVVTDAALGSVVYAPDSQLANEAVNYDHLLLLGPAQSGYFDTPSRMPGALIEPLYITDPFEASIAAGVRGEHTIAAGLAEAVGQYFATG